MITSIAYILTLAALSRLCGWGVEADASETTKKLTEFFGKASCAMLVAFTSLAYTHDLFLALIIGSGWLVWRAFGCNDRIERDWQQATPWLNLSINPNFNLSERIIYMGLRGSLSSLPLFIGLAVYFTLPSLSFLALPMALQGVIFFGLKRFLPQWYTVAAEVALGALIGALIVGAV